MKISLDWISDFVDLNNIDPQELADKLSIHTAEVEGIEHIDKSIAGMLIGEIIEVKEFVHKKKILFIVNVKVGNKQWQSVCSAPNVNLGMKVVVAPEGSCLADKSIVKKITLMNHKSECVLCSSKELGMGLFHDKLLECHPDLVTGVNLSDLIPSKDILIDIDNKSLTHRPDLWGHYGFAREIAAIYSLPLKNISGAKLNTYENLPEYPIMVKDTDKCPYYSVMEISVSENPPSPLIIQSRLLVLGYDTFNSLVDTTNYVQLEIGQPTHGYDSKTIVGDICVGNSNVDRGFTTLDDKNRKVLKNDLLVFCNSKPIALAGIMGGTSSKIESHTQKVIFESANFKASTIRKTSVRLSLRTDSSLRFEKKIPPLSAKVAMERILYLLTDMKLDPKPLSKYSSIGDIKDKFRSITIPSGYFTKRSGTPINNKTASKILESIGFPCNEISDGELNVKIPPFRSENDISIIEDISEEVMRIYGYDNITPVMPTHKISTVPINAITHNQHRIRYMLSQAYSFSEVQTYSWFENDWINTIRYTPRKTLNLINPISVGRKCLRDSLLPNLAAMAHDSRKHREDFKIYEFGKVFWIDASNEKNEELQVAGLSIHQSGTSSIEDAFYAMRGVIDDIAKTSSIKGEFSYFSQKNDSIWDGYSLVIKHDNEDVGEVSIVPDLIGKEIVKSGFIISFFLRIELCMAKPYPSITYKKPSKFPGSWQDFTLSWSIENGFSELNLLLSKFQHKLLTRYYLVDFYQIDSSKLANYTFRFEFQDQDRTITSEELQSFHKKVLEFINHVELDLVI